MTDEMYDELKKAVFNVGVNAIEDLIGVELEFNTDDEILDAMDETLSQMPEDIALELHNKYCK